MQWINFSDWAQIFGFLHGENPQIAKFLKNGPFSRKIVKNGYHILPKSPLKMGRGFEARVTHPCPTQIWVPPPQAIHFLSFVFAVFTCPWYTVNSVTCAPFACFCFGSLLNSVVFWLCITCILDTMDLLQPGATGSMIIRMSWFSNCDGLSGS